MEKKTVENFFDICAKLGQTEEALLGQMLKCLALKLALFLFQMQMYMAQHCLLKRV